MMAVVSAGRVMSVRVFIAYLLVSVFALGLLVWSAAPAAAVEAPGWQVTSASYPTVLPPGGTDHLEINVYNTGAAHSKGPVTVTDRLPAGVIATEAGYYEKTIEGENLQWWDCSGLSTSTVTCTSDPTYLPSIPHHPKEERSEYYGSRVQLGVIVRVEPGLQGLFENRVTVSGGGALEPASVTEPMTVSSTPASSFGFNEFDGWFSSPDGTSDTQAGSHPYSATFSFDLNTVEEERFHRPAYVGGRARNIDTVLPPGLVGNPTAVPECPQRLLTASSVPACPVSTQVGWDSPEIPGLGYSAGEELVPGRLMLPVFNMVPPPGVPAEFAFSIVGIPVRLDASVRSGGDYGITVHVDNIFQQDAPGANTITFWGEPSDPRHDFERRIAASECPEGCSSNAERKPFLTMPTSCGSSGQYGIDATTWENLNESSDDFFSHDNAHERAGLSGCDHLSFKPSISVAPDTSYADTPAGLTVEVKVPQEGLLDPNGLAMSNIKDTTVALPKGVVVNPGQAAGLGACGANEDALTTEAEKTEGKENSSAPSCPNDSRVGTVQIATPLLKDDLEGSVYVLQSNPPHLKLLMAASGDGVNLKLVGDVNLDEQTGQLVTTFSETPELPFTDLKLSFSGGAQAALSTPVECGVYSTSSDFTPWSTPEVPDSFPQSNFQIDHGTGGAPCPSSPPPFQPSMIAGSTTDQAAGFTDFSLLLTRPDDQQRISGLQFRAPEGLLGMISQVQLCPEPQAQQGTCSSASQIGHTVVEAGPGPYPLVVPQPGQPPAPIYLTGPYKGAPYGLSIVVPLVVGPFTLQTQIVRAKIEVDPITAQITVMTDPLPQIIDGVPADLRTINALIDRPGFMFNPSDCQPMSFSGTAYSSEGASAPLSSHFQMGSCQSLAFKPNFKVSTNGKTSRKNGASLTATIIYPTGPAGNNQASSQSNVAQVKVDLPKQLPSRLPTLQKACPARVFNTNPAGCPAGSIVGHATAITPLLPVPVTGPAYFVSYGGAKFPELVIVLQGYGVTIYLHGETFINERTSITSSTFRQVPDVPITSFELNLPQGPDSALAANANLCNVKKLLMPTIFVGHNGARIKQNTPIAVTGCPKHKASKHSAKGRKGKASGSAGSRHGGSG